MVTLMQTTDLITSPQAAAILGRSPRTIHRLVESGALTPALRISSGPNGAYLFHRADVEALRDARRAESEVAS